MGRFGVVLGIALVLASCSGKKDGEPSLCETLAKEMRDCGLLTSGQVNCYWVTDTDQSVCESECRLGLSCDDLQQWVCDLSMTTDLAACYDACAETWGFHCADGSDIIYQGWECDDDPDCADGSDEGTRCWWDCADGSGSILQRWVCDGFLDCDDGSDEEGCPYIELFECRDGTEIIPRSWVCDFEPDCTDGSDELRCATEICP